MSKKIHIVFGRQGAGKSTYAQQLAKEINGVYFSIDEWMWKLYGEDMPKSMNLRWIMERVERCEKRIWAITQQISHSGVEVVLDLGFTKFEKRKLFSSLAKAENIPTQIHYLKAPHAVRKKRVLDRNKEKGETYSFEVTPGMFDFMEGEFQDPREKELKNAIVVDTGGEK
ncbi:MAG: ATP-binding protein [Bacteroidota bacterium]